jgi:hypothetical protein
MLHAFHCCLTCYTCIPDVSGLLLLWQARLSVGFEDTESVVSRPRFPIMVPLRTHLRCVAFFNGAFYFFLQHSHGRTIFGRHTCLNFDFFLERTSSLWRRRVLYLGYLQPAYRDLLIIPIQSFLFNDLHHLHLKHIISFYQSF